jgi:hypothetical protein
VVVALALQFSSFIVDLDTPSKYIGSPCGINLGFMYPPEAHHVDGLCWLSQLPSSAPFKQWIEEE